MCVLTLNAFTEAGAERIIEGRRKKKYEQNLLISQLWQEILCVVWSIWCFDIGMATFVPSVLNLLFNVTDP